MFTFKKEEIVHISAKTGQGVDELLEQIVKKEKPLLYILTDIDIPFVQDGTRDGEHLRSWMHGRFLEKLNRDKLNYLVVSGNRQERLSKSVKKINSLFYATIGQLETEL